MKSPIVNLDRKKTIKSAPLILLILIVLIGSWIFGNFKIKTNSLEAKIESLSTDVSELTKSVNNSPCRSNILHEYNIKGVPLKFYDSIWSATADIVAEELKNNPEYNFENIDFKEGDSVIDIGGNIGMISIFLAKKYPFIKIYAFEPVKQNYENFLKNIEINNIPKGTITVENKAVTHDKRNISMSVCYHNMGGSRVSTDSKQTESIKIPSVTLQNIFDQYKINKLKLLKIDCEGSEYEILYNTLPKTLMNIEYLKGEFHTVKDSDVKNCPEQLIEFCGKYISPENIVVNISGCSTN